MTVGFCWRMISQAVIDRINGSIADYLTASYMKLRKTAALSAVVEANRSGGAALVRPILVW